MVTISRLSSPVPTTVHAFTFIATRLQPFLASSTRIELRMPTHVAKQCRQVLLLRGEPQPPPAPPLPPPCAPPPPPHPSPSPVPSSSCSAPRSASPQVWQDLSSWNVEFSTVYPEYSLKSINRWVGIVVIDMHLAFALGFCPFFALPGLSERSLAPLVIYQVLMLPHITSNRQGRVHVFCRASRHSTG